MSPVPIATPPDAYVDSAAFTTRPDDLQVASYELGRGNNNRVYRAKWRGGRCAFRMPRRRGDTARRGNAVWECQHTLLASQLGVGPEVYAAWYARHAGEDGPAGLYLVTEVFTQDLDRLLLDPARRAQTFVRSKNIGEAVVRCLETLARAHLFVYDLKPSNLVVHLPDDDDAPVRAKVIDFGREFCEWGGGTRADASTPTIDLIRRRIRAEGKGDHKEEEDRLLSHILFATMLVQLSATTTVGLRDDRGKHRMSAEERRDIHPLAPYATKLLDSMQGAHLRLLRDALRADGVRDVLAHYHGRRNAGTRRTLRYARGMETR